MMTQMVFYIHITPWHPMASVWMVDMVPIVWTERLRSQGAHYAYDVTGMVHVGLNGSIPRCF